MSYKLQLIITDEMAEKVRKQASEVGLSMSAYGTLLVSDGMKSRENQDVMRGFAKVLSHMSEDDVKEQLKLMTASNFMKFKEVTEQIENDDAVKNKIDIKGEL